MSWFAKIGTYFVFLQIINLILRIMKKIIQTLALATLLIGCASQPQQELY